MHDQSYEEHVINDQNSDVVTSNATRTQYITNQQHLALLSLACGTFALGVNEFIPMSFLSEISDEYSITISKASWLLTAFMLGCTISAPVIMPLAVKYEYKYLLISLQSVLILASTICTLSPNFSILLVGRILSSFSHAAYFGIGSSTVENLIPKEMQGYATSFFFPVCHYPASLESLWQHFWAQKRNGITHLFLSLVALHYQQLE